jgi:hypothetical protein
MQHLSTLFLNILRWNSDLSEMPPKADRTNGALSNAEFLMACIRNGKEKLNVDFEGLAKQTGMSTGGAA